MAKRSYILKIIIAILVAIGGWAIFNTVQILFSEALLSVGVEFELAQMLVIIVVIAIILLILGVSFKKQISRMIG